MTNQHLDDSDSGNEYTFDGNKGFASYAENTKKRFSPGDEGRRTFLQNEMEMETSISWMDARSNLMDSQSISLNGSMNLSFLGQSEAIKQVKAPVAPQASIVSINSSNNNNINNNKRTRFADVIATDFETNIPSHESLNIFSDAINDEHSLGNTSMVSLDFVSGQERALPFGNDSSNFDYEGSLDSFNEGGNNGDDSLQKIQDAQEEEAKKERRQIMYAVGGAGVFALFGWVVRKLTRTIEEEGEDREAGGIIRENLGAGGRDQATQNSHVSQAELVNVDGGSFNLDTSGNMSQSGMSQSAMSQSQLQVIAGGWGGAGGGQAAANPVLQSQAVHFYMGVLAQVLIQN